MSLAPVIDLSLHRRPTAETERAEPPDGPGADIVSLDEWRRAKTASKRRHPATRSAA